MNNVVLKGKLGAGFNDDRYTLPKDGNPGDILVKTETGSEWQKQEPATSTPDWNQNDSTASDYIKNRPGGYTVNYPALNIEWDGVIGDRVSVDLGGGKFVKVSDEIPKIEMLVSGVFIVKNGDVYNEYIITDRMIMDFGNSIYGSELLLVVNKAPANFVHQSTGEVLAVFPETGVYFMRSTDSVYVSSLSLHAKSEIVQIPQRYVDGLEETTANANQALETATAAQSTANTANSKADSAQSTANTAKSTADAAQSSADAAKSIAEKKEDRTCGIIWNNSSYNVRDIVYGNGIYIARNVNDVLNPLYSEDAISWNNINLHLTSSDWEIAYGQGKFVILQKLSDSSGTAIYASTDGKMWIKHNDQLGMKFDTVQYIDELWVAYTKGTSRRGSGLWYSEDGINWSQSNINSERIYGIAKSTNKWVVMHPTTGIYYSEDGKTYTLSNLTGENRYGVIRYANGIFVYAYKDTVHYSENGEIWVQATSNDVFPSDITDVMYEDGIWVMTADDHIPMYSVDGKIWSKGTGTYSWSRYLSYGDGTWVAYDNGISSSDKGRPPIYSKDGVNWNKCNIAESYINKPAYADGIWIVSSRYNQYNNVRGIFYSFDAVNWYKLDSIDEEYFPDAYNINGVWRCKSYYSVDKYLSRETANNKLAEINSQLDNLSKKISGDVIINSSTPDSTKKFKITVDDTGTISATEVT